MSHALTVKQLIKQLEKLDPNARVAHCSHDQNAHGGETNGPISSATESPDALKERGYGVYLS